MDKDKDVPTNMPESPDKVLKCAEGLLQCTNEDVSLWEDGHTQLWSVPYNSMLNLKIHRDADFFIQLELRYDDGIKKRQASILITSEQARTDIITILDEIRLKYYAYQRANPDSLNNPIKKNFVPPTPPTPQRAARRSRVISYYSSVQRPSRNDYSYPVSTKTNRYSTYDFSHEKELGWWKSFSEKHPYPLYCILLTESTDEMARRFMEQERTFIDRVTGKECCLIYFRDLDRAKSFDNSFDLSEHTRWNDFISNYTGVEFDKYPCFLFFEDFTQSDWIIFSLKGMGLAQVKTLFQKICDYIHQPQKPLLTDKEKSAFEKLSQYGKGHALKKRGKVFGRWIEEYAPGIIAEFLKTMIGLP